MAYKDDLEAYKGAIGGTQKDIDQLASMGITDSRVNNLRSQLLTQQSGQNYANLKNSYIAENPNGTFSPEFLEYAKLAGDKDIVNTQISKGVLTQNSAIAQEAENQAGVTAGTLKPVQIGTGTGYVPTGSAADTLQQGISSGAVSPTNPTQQFNASMQGNNVNAPGVVPIAPTDINAKYQQGFTQTQASGVPAPSDGGIARQTIQQTIPSPAQTNPVLDNLFAEDKNITNFSKIIQDFLSPQTQQTTLRQEYESLAKAKGIEGMNTELMNMKNVIEGTEDDIRTEITKSGGFATDSQVLALSNARNKTLIKNYNNLLQTKQQAEQYVSTLMGLEQADRQAASDKLDKQLNLTFQLADYQEKMQTNARNTLQKVVDEVGYAGLAQMTQGNSYYTSLVENTLGLGAGGLNQLATYKKPLTEEEQANLDYKKAQTAELGKKDLQFVSGTENQASGYFDKTTGKFTSFQGGKAGGGTDLIINTIKNDPLKSSEQKNTDILNELLKDSKKISAGTKTQMANTLGVVNALQDLATQRQTTGFKGISPFNALLDIQIPFTDINVLPFRESMKSKEAVENRQYLEAINLKVQQWASGASLTKQQTDQVNQFTPRPTDTDEKVRTKINGLANFMMTQVATQLQTEGINFKPEKVNLFETYDLLKNASPEQKAALKAQGLIQ